MNAGLVLVLCFFSVTSVAQNKFTVNGYVRDSASGETIISATVSINNLSRGVTTNQYGFYSITLDSGNYELTVSHVSFQSKPNYISLKENQSLDFLLLPKSAAISEVVVYSKRKSHSYRNAAKGL